jgi:hypothetical protein
MPRSKILTSIVRFAREWGMEVAQPADGARSEMIGHAVVGSTVA